MTEPREPNRSWWDERAALHGQDAVYDTAGFLAGASTLSALDRNLLGPLDGHDAIHLQCHTGMDTLSLLRAGARSVTGVDFSAVAIEKARATAAAVGLAERATFVRSDVLDVPAALHGRFDRCYASRGVLGWIDDVTAWMRTARAVLRPGGRLVLVDVHPLFGMVDDLDPLTVDFPYVNDGPRRFEEPGSYAVPDADTVHNVTVEFGHSLGEIVTAAVAAGLVVDSLGEHVESDMGRGLLRRDEDGCYRWRQDGELLPVMYSLTATVPAGEIAG